MISALVGGIERFASPGHQHIAIECDVCKKRYFGGNGGTVPGPLRPRGYNVCEEEGMKKDARKLGWTGDFTRDSTNDRCPDCAGLKVMNKTFPISMGIFEYGSFKIVLERIAPRLYTVTTSGFEPVLCNPPIKVYTDDELAAKAFHRHIRAALNRCNEAKVVGN